LTIDKNGPLPLYFQLKEWLIGQIEQGILLPGNQIPTELALAERYALSRGTVRQAINELVHEGHLYRIHGRGTFVSAPRVEHRMAQMLTSFAEDMRDQAIPFSSRCLSRKVLAADDWLAGRLHIGPQDRVICLERLGHVNDEPIVIAHTYLPLTLCPTLVEDDLTDCSLYALLESKYNITLCRARRTLEPALADEYEARMLQIRKGSAIHLMETCAYDTNDRPIEFSRLRFRGDRSRFVFEVGRPSLSTITPTTEMSQLELLTQER
jgi:GntR family transcriptional regulator